MPVPAPRRRVWCETLALRELVKPSVVNLLHEFDVAPIVAVRPWDLGELAQVAEAFRDASIDLIVWPMIEDKKGRWLHRTNVTSFDAFVRAIFDLVESKSSAIDECVLDFEPPIDRLRPLFEPSSLERWLFAARALSGSLGRRLIFQEPGFVRADRGIRAMLAFVRGKGARVTATLWPGGDSRLMQHLLGTPVPLDLFDTVDVMVYTSIVRGLTGGALSAPQARRLMRMVAKRATTRFGSRSSLSLGAVGTGAFANERVFQDPSELYEDVLAVLPFQPARLNLFDLGGLISRAPAREWLDAFCANE